MLDFKNSFMLGSQEGKEGGGGILRFEHYFLVSCNKFGYFFVLKSSNLNITSSLGYNVEETNPVDNIENKKDTGEQNEKHQVQSCRFHLLVSSFFICFFPFSLSFSLSIRGNYQL